jgi:hypothetical protein
VVEVNKSCHTGISPNLRFQMGTRRRATRWNACCRDLKGPTPRMLKSKGFLLALEPRNSITYVDGVNRPDPSVVPRLEALCQNRSWSSPAQSIAGLGDGLYVRLYMSILDSRRVLCESFFPTLRLGAVQGLMSVCHYQNYPIASMLNTRKDSTYSASLLSPQFLPLPSFAQHKLEHADLSPGRLANTG